MPRIWRANSCQEPFRAVQFNFSPCKTGTCNDFIFVKQSSSKRGSANPCRFGRATRRALTTRSTCASNIHLFYWFRVLLYPYHSSQEGMKLFSKKPFRPEVFIDWLSRQLKLDSFLHRIISQRYNHSIGKRSQLFHEINTGLDCRHLLTRKSLSCPAQLIFLIIIRWLRRLCSTWNQSNL